MRSLINYFNSYDATSARSKVEAAVQEYKTAKEAKSPARHAKFRALVSTAAECREISTSATDLQAGVISFISPRTKIANPADQRKIPQLRKVGEKFKPTTLPRKSIETPPEILAEDDVALRARLTGEHCRDIIDLSIREGREFTREERFEIAKFHNSLQVLSGNLPHPGLNQRYAMPELLTYMQERATKIVAKQLEPLGKPLLNLKTDQKAYVPALTALNLNPDLNHVTPTQIQEALVRMAPNDAKIGPILTGLGIPVAAQPQLFNALRSQKNLDEDVRKANEDIKQLNKFRAGTEASPQHEAARKGLAELKNIETWNRLLKDFTPEDKRAGLSSVAALEATRAVLSSPTDIQTADLKEKISKPVTAATQKDAKPITASAEAAQQGAEHAILTTKDSLEKSSEAKSAAGIAIKSLIVTNIILGADLKNFEAQILEDEEENLEDLFEKPIETALQGQPALAAPDTKLALDITKEAKDHKAIQSLRDDREISKIQKRVGLAAAIGQAVYDLRIQGTTPKFCKDLAAEYLANGSMDEKALNDFITNYPGLPPAASSPETRSKIHSAILTVQIIAEGIAASNKAVASAETSVEKTKTTLHPAIAKKVSSRLQSEFESQKDKHEQKAQQDQKVQITNVIGEEINRANQIIQNISDIKAEALAPETKIEAKASTSPPQSQPTSPDQAQIQEAKQAEAKKAKEAKELSKKLKDAVIKNYLDIGPSALETKAIAAVVEPLLPAVEDKEALKNKIVKQFDTSIRVVLADEHPEGLVQLPDPAVQHKSSDIEEFTKEVIAIHKAIPGKVAHDAALAIAKRAGVPDKEAEEVAKAAQKEIDDNKSPQQAAEAAIKLVSPQYQAAFVPLAAVLSRHAGLPIGTAATTPPQDMAQQLNRPFIQKAYAQGRSRTANSTATAAIGAAVAATMSTFTSVPAVDSNAVVSDIVAAYLKHGVDEKAIDTAIAKTPGITAPEKTAIISEVRKAVLISVGMQAVQATAKDATKNTRAIAGTVAVAASHLGASQENALKWSKALADYYTKQPAELDSKKATEITEKVTELCPEVQEIKDGTARNEMIQSMIDATRAASGVPAKADATAAGTTVAAKLYSAFDKPLPATAVAAVVTEAHHGDSSAVNNAAAYTQKLGNQVLTDYAHISASAVVGAAFAEQAEDKFDPNGDGENLIPPLRRTAQFVDSVRDTIALAKLDMKPGDPNYDNNLKKTAGITGSVLATAAMLGLTDTEAKRAARAASSINIRTRTDDREALVSGISVALASAKVQDYWRTLDGVGAAVGAQPVALPGIRIGANIVRNAQTGPRNTPWDAKTVNELAQQAYHSQYRTTEQAANTALGDNIHRSSLAKAYAEVAGKAAMIDAYYTAMKGKPPLSSADYHEASVRAMQASQEMRASIEKLKQDLTEAAPDQAQIIRAIPIPVAEPESTARKLASSSVTTSLIQTGIAAGQGADANAQSLAAITAIATEEQMDQKEQTQFLEDAKKILESPAKAAKAGALIATLTKSLSPEAARAMAAAVAHFKATPLERAQAIRQATTTASVIIDERDSLPSAPDGAEKRHSLEQYNKDEFTKRQQNVDELLAAMDAAEKSKCPTIEDSVGLDKAFKEARLDDAHKLNAINIEEWSITTTTGRGVQKTIRIKDIPALAEAMKQIKACHPYVSIQTIEKAMKEWNKTHWTTKFSKKSGSSLTGKPIEGDYPISKTADGGFDIDMTGFSDKDTVEFFKLVATHAKEDKKTALKDKVQDKIVTPAADKPGTLKFQP